MRRPLLALASLAALALATPALAQRDAICDPYNPTHCLAPNADGSLNLDATDAANLAGPLTTFTSTGAQVTITTGGTPQNLFAGVKPTNGFEVCNVSGTEDAWISETTTAAPNTGYRLPANGGCYDSPQGVKPYGVVSVYAATTGHPLTPSSW